MQVNYKQDGFAFGNIIKKYTTPVNQSKKIKLFIIKKQ